MSLRRFLAGPLSFGLTLGLAIVAFLLEGASLSAFPVTGLILWGGAIAVTALTMTIGLPTLHVAASGLLLLATARMIEQPTWALPLAASVATMGVARFASVGFVSRWLARLVGLAAIAAIVALVLAEYSLGISIGGSEEGRVLELASATGALVVLAVLGFWHRGDAEDDD